MSIKNKFITAIICFSLIPLLLIKLIIYNHSKNALFTAIENQLRETAAVQTSRIQVTIERYVDTMKMLANRPTLKQNLALYNSTADVNALKYIDNAIGHIRQSVPMFYEISIVDTERKVVSSSKPSSIGSVFKESDVLPARYSDCGYVDVFKGKDNIPSLRFSCHLKLNNKIVGYVTALVHGDFLNEITGDYSNLGKTGETVVAKKDDHGNALFIVPLRFDADAAFKRKVSKEDTGVLITQALLRKNNLFREYKDYAGTPVYGVCNYLEKTGWGIVVKMHKSEMMAPLVQLRNILIYSYILIMGIMVIIALLVSRAITAPLAKLINATKRIGKGDFSHTISHDSKDETGVLVTVFNQMIDELSAREYELSKHRQSLEILVYQRTDELRAANELLETEVAFRKVTELDLLKTNNQLDSLINAIPDLIIFKDTKKRYLVVNRAFEEITGFRKEEAIGKKVEDCFPADIAASSTLEDETVMQTQHSMRRVITLNAEESVIYLDMINSPILDHAGNLIGIVVIGRDITEMKTMTNALAESKEKYRALVENSNDIIVRLDKDQRCLYINQAITQYTDLSPVDFVGKTNSQVDILGHSSVLWEDTVQQIFDTRTGQEIEIEFAVRGTKLYFLSQFIPEFDTTGNVITVAVVSRDITKRVELEHQLMEKNEMLEDIVKVRTAKLVEYNRSLTEEVRLRKDVEIQLAREKNISDTIVNTLPGIFCFINDSGSLLLWNKNMETITEYSSDEIMEMNIFDFFSAERKDAAQSEIKDMFVNKKGDYEMILYTKIGRQVQFYFVGSAVNLDNSSYLALIGIDITVRKAIETELISSRERLRLNAIHLQNTIEEDRKKIARELHDDLSQALTVLKIEIVDINKSTGVTQVISNKVNNCTGIVDNIMDNMHNLVMSLRPTVLDDFGLIPAIEWQIGQLQKRTGKVFEFDTNITNKTYLEALNRSHALTLYRVFQEAITNVIRHAEAEKVIIRLRDQEGAIIMEVQDNGKGTDEAAMFDYKSLGIIGMKERVLHVGGTLDISKAPSGSGTKITVTVPVKKEEEGVIGKFPIPVSNIPI